MSINRLTKSTERVLKEAERYHMLRDEENAYIFYMKYFNLITVIQKCRDFAKIKNKSREYFGSNEDIFKRMDVLRELKDSLIKR